MMDADTIYKISLSIASIGYLLLKIWEAYRKYKYEETHEGTVII